MAVEDFHPPQLPPDEGAEETVVTTIMMMIIIWVLEVNTPLSLSPFHLAGLVDTLLKNCKQSETQRMQSFSIYHRKDIFILIRKSYFCCTRGSIMI